MFRKTVIYSRTEQYRWTHTGVHRSDAKFWKYCQFSAIHALRLSRPSEPPALRPSMTVLQQFWDRRFHLVLKLSHQVWIASSSSPPILKISSYWYPFSSKSAARLSLLSPSFRRPPWPLPSPAFNTANKSRFSSPGHKLIWVPFPSVIEEWPTDASRGSHTYTVTTIIPDTTKWCSKQLAHTVLGELSEYFL